MYLCTRQFSAWKQQSELARAPVRVRVRVRVLGTRHLEDGTMVISPSTTFYEFKKVRVSVRVLGTHHSKDGTMVFSPLTTIYEFRKPN